MRAAADVVARADRQRELLGLTLGLRHA